MLIVVDAGEVHLSRNPDLGIKPVGKPAGVARQYPVRRHAKLFLERYKDAVGYCAVTGPVLRPAVR